MPEAPRSLAAAVAALAADFRGAGIEAADRDARILVLAAAGLDRLDLLRDPDRLLDSKSETQLTAYRQRRLSREPVSRILGRREFWSLDLEVTPDVLDPRPETELLVEAALDYLREQKRQGDRLTILDLGTGSGAILIALLRELPHAFGIGVDMSPDAVVVARRNAVRHGVGERASFIVGNWAEAIAGPVDLIVSNPPYLLTAEIAEAACEVRDYDPVLALDGGTDGLTAYRIVVAAWQRLGAPPMLLEIGASQSDLVVDMIEEKHDLTTKIAVAVDHDLAGLPRLVAALPQAHFPT